MKLASLVMELAEAVDNAANDIGGSRPQLDILREAVQEAELLGRVKQVRWAVANQGEIVDGNIFVTKAEAVNCYNRLNHVFPEEQRSIVPLYTVIRALAAKPSPAAPSSEAWIPVGERLPDGEYDVLVTDGTFVSIGDYDGNQLLWQAQQLAGEKITAWMPLPAAPAKGK